MVRNALGVSFNGIAYKEPWRLWDLELDTSLDPDDAHIFLLDHGCKRNDRAPKKL